MLDFLLLLTLFIMAFITIWGIFNFTSKFSKCICIIAAILLSFSFSVTMPIYNNATSEPEISNIEFSEIYKADDNQYYVKLKDNEKPLKVTTTNVYKGESNYLISIHCPNMTKVHEFLFEKEKTEYTLVVTNLNIPVLSEVD